MMTGPVSQLLQAELLQEIRRQGILVWLDKDASYTGFVDRLIAQHKAGEFPYPVIGFRGSFLETLFELETYGSGYEKHSLVVHMPGFNEDSIRTTPVLELYSAGTRFRKLLDTLVRQAATGRVLPAEVDEFLKGKPSLEKADDWLALTVSKRTVGLEALLDTSGQSLIVEALAGHHGALADRVTTDEEAKALRSWLHKLTGMDDEWMASAHSERNATPLDKVLSAFGSWILCVEYVHDLKRPPHLGFLKPLKALSEPLVAQSKTLVLQFRKNHAEAYVRIADETETMLEVELKAMTPEDLGKVDTFREEENRVLRGAVEVLKARDWDRAAEWCKAREGDRSFWLQKDQVRRRAWDLVGEAAAFGKILTQHARPLEKAQTHDDALRAYAESAAQVDQAHRRFEQEWLRRLDTQMPHFGALQEVLGVLRQLHREWADQLARDFTRVCRNQGFLPPAELQQRTLFEQVVVPMTSSGERVAVFLLDAFRYEMAAELVQDLRATGGGASVDLKARLAELPTITAVGMNVLPPVTKEGRLEVAGKFQGFKASEYTIRTPGDRAKTMGMRVSGKAGLCLTLAQVCESPDSLKGQLKDHQIVIVRSSEIDDAGEANVGLLTFEAQLRQIKAAWHHLQTAGIKHAVFTADHGFLLQDSTTKTRSFGKKTDCLPRYIIDDHERGETGIVPIALSKLGYEGISGYVLVPEDTAVFDTGKGSSSFVHGGNSPQERIIPVLTITRKRAEASSLAEYAVEAEVMNPAFGFHHIKLRLVFPKESQTSLGFAGARSIDLELRVPDRKEIRATVKEVSGAGSFKSGRINAPVGDTWTEIYFALTGPVDERVRVEVHHADNIEKVRSFTPDALFEVTGTGGASVPPPATSWADQIEDEPTRRILLHIEKHGSITESEIVNMLGNSRAERRFGARLDICRPKLPFNVRSEANASGKRYVREEEK